MFALVRGPLVWASLLVFILGTIFQVLRFFTLSRKAAIRHRVQAFPSEKKPEKGISLRAVGNLFQSFWNTVLGVYPVTIAVTTIFHVCLIFVPLFLLGHNELLDLSLGVSLPSMPEQVSDVLSIVLLACCAFFLCRRIFVSRVRAITSFYDYLVLVLAAVPFLSGFLGYHQIFDYRTVMLVHMLSGELLLIAIPFTKLTHMVFFFLSRIMIINEHTLGKGSRAW